MSISEILDDPPNPYHRDKGESMSKVTREEMLRCFDYLSEHALIGKDRKNYATSRIAEQVKAIRRLIEQGKPKVSKEDITARFELREEDGRLYWWGAENGWKDATEIGEKGVITIDAKGFEVGTVILVSEPSPQISTEAGVEVEDEQA
jgi:hypothetical protein